VAVEWRLRTGGEADVMDPSTAERCNAELFLPKGEAFQRLPWPAAVLTIAGLAGTLWAVLGLVAVRLFT
jgi:hypothetical protein